MDATPTLPSQPSSPIITSDCWLPQIERAIDAAADGTTIVLEKPDLMCNTALSKAASQGKNIKFVGPDGQQVTKREFLQQPELDQGPGVNKTIQIIRITLDAWEAQILAALKTNDAGDLVLALERPDLMLRSARDILATSDVAKATNRRVYLLEALPLAN